MMEDDEHPFSASIKQKPKKRLSLVLKGTSSPDEHGNTSPTESTEVMSQAAIKLSNKQFDSSTMSMARELGMSSCLNSMHSALFPPPATFAG